MPRITDKQIIDVYEKFKTYYLAHQKDFDILTQKEITDKITSLIINEKKFTWNVTSLTDYVNDLVYLVRGQQFARTINKFAETYFIDNICNDFGPILCENAKKSLALHKVYYKELTSNNQDLKKYYKEYFPKLLASLSERKNEFDADFKTDQTYNAEEEKPRHYISFPAGKSSIKYGCVYTKGYANGLVVELYFDGDHYRERFENLLKNKDEIEKKYEGKLIWQEDTGKARRVLVSYDCEIKNKQHWSKFITWQIDHLVKFRKIFQPYIDLIDVGINLLDFPSIEPAMQATTTIKNILLYGVPGVGKTHNTNKLIGLIEEGKSEQEIFETISKNEPFTHNAKTPDLESRVKFVTFHQSFGYEDFIEGFRPNEKGDIELQKGIFKTICEEANENRDQNYYLVVDEINRGNISKIFGELITLIEEDKRDTLEATLPYSKKSFSIPSNLFIIGTMNSTDKSIALIDIALRRRFTFVKMLPNYELIHHSKSKFLLTSINEKITKRLGEDYQIGHSYFMKIENDEDLSFVIHYKIKPLLEEYFYGDSDGLNDILALMDT